MRTHLLHILDVGDAELDMALRHCSSTLNGNNLMLLGSRNSSSSSSVSMVTALSPPSLSTTSASDSDEPSRRSSSSSVSSRKSAPERGQVTSTLRPKRIRRPSVFKVTHKYRDYSRTSFDEYMRAHPYQKPAREVKTFPSFPRCLHAMLENARAADQEDVVSWQPHGRAFIVHKPEEFTANILPLYFRQTK